MAGDYVEVFLRKRKCFISGSLPVIWRCSLSSRFPKCAASKRKKTSCRRTPTLLLVGTLVCTWIGSGSLFGSAGLGFRSGFSALWFSAGAGVGIAIVYFLAYRVRRIAQYTLSDILETRYNKWARLLGTLAIIIAYLTISACRCCSPRLAGGNRCKLCRQIISRFSVTTTRCGRSAFFFPRFFCCWAKAACSKNFFPPKMSVPRAGR